LELIHVIAAVIRRQDRVLVCQRPAGKRHGGLWEFPGGKVDPGEDAFAAAARELAEELGIRVIAVGAAERSIRDAGSPFVIDFVPVAIEGEPRCLEHEALRWATAAELRSLALAPSDREYAEWLNGPESDPAPAPPAPDDRP
jgi:8-oxo-dGTP diphosphatase